MMPAAAMPLMITLRHLRYDYAAMARAVYAYYYLLRHAITHISCLFYFHFR